MFISEVHGNIDTSPCRSNIQSWPKGNEGLASLVGLAHAGRAGPSHPRSGGIVPRSSVARNTHGNTKRRYNKLPVWLQDYPLKDTYHYYYHLGWGGLGGILIVHHHYIPDSTWPLKDAYHCHLGARHKLFCNKQIIFSRTIWCWWWWSWWWWWWWWWWSWWSWWWSWWRWWSFPIRANDGVWP